MPVDTVEVERNPPNAPLRQRDPKTGEAPQRRAEEQILSDQHRDLRGNDHLMVEWCLWREFDQI